MARVIAAVSGGVDSAVAAARLIESGHDVTAVTLRMLPEGTLPAADESVESARAVAGALGIPHTVVDASERFDSCILAYLADAYASGKTPNPCVRCNDEVKFQVLFDEAARTGAEQVATGHYARIVEHAGELWVARGSDSSKDQSYFLYRLDSETLARTLFPLGESRKSDVRAEADARALPAAYREESQDVCFATAGGLSGLVVARRPEAGAPGPIVDPSGKRIGTHRGLAYYTVGQRKGLGIGGPMTWYVAAIDAAHNTLRVSLAEDLMRDRVQARPASWRGGEGDVRCLAQVRYRSAAVPAVGSFDGTTLTVEFDSPVQAPAPGQSVVCYEGDRVIGGGEMFAT